MFVRNSSSSWFGSLDLTLACWVILHTFCLMLIFFFFFKINILKDNSLSNTIRVSNNYCFQFVLTYDLDAQRTVASSIGI